MLLQFISLPLGQTGAVKNNLILFQKAEIVLVLLLCSGETFSKQFNKQQISQADCFLFAQFFNRSLAHLPISIGFKVSSPFFHFRQF